MPTPPPSHVVSARGLSVALSQRPVLHEINLSVDAGSWLGVLGPNGSGKTTLLRAISGALPHKGTLTLWGRPTRAYRPAERARRLAFVRQAAALSFDFRVDELVLLGRSPHKRWLEGYTTDDRVRVQAALHEVGLDGFAGRSALSLSGGERQRVFLAQALVQEAELLLLDEPTAHLDVHHQYELMEHVRCLVEAGRTAIAVFHDLALAARYADAVAVLDEGRLVAFGSPRDVLTETLIASVFRMRARVEPAASGLRLDYLAPL